MNKLIILLSLVGILLTSCEKYETIEYDIPFKSKVVTASFLNPDENQISVWLTRTTKPIGTEAPQEPIIVTDAEVTLIHEGNNFTLVYDSINKVYTGDMNGVPFEPGKTYELLIKTADETITGATTIPLPATTETTVKVDSIYNINGLNYLVTFNTKQLSPQTSNLFIYPYMVFDDSSRYAMYYDGRDRIRTIGSGQSFAQSFTGSYTGARLVRIELLTFTCDKHYTFYYNKGATFSYGSLGMAFGEVNIAYSNMSNKIGVFGSYVASGGASFPMP